jgi:hypothetical protein
MTRTIYPGGRSVSFLCSTQLFPGSQTSTFPFSVFVFLCLRGLNIWKIPNTFLDTPFFSLHDCCSFHSLKILPQVLFKQVGEWCIGVGRLKKRRCSGVSWRLLFVANENGIEVEFFSITSL